MNVASKNKMAGSFGFCAGCPTSLNCCSRMNHHSVIENALVFTDEVIAIESYSGVPQIKFLKKNSIPGDHPFRTIANAKTGGCIFPQRRALRDLFLAYPVNTLTHNM